MALMILGDFVFELRTAPFEQKQRSTQYKWSSNNRIGQRPAHQSVGLGDDSLTLSGVLYHEVTGHSKDLNVLRELAEKGEPQVMVDDDGFLKGWWIIEQIDETGSVFFPDGQPRKIEFSLQLKQTDSPGQS